MKLQTRIRNPAILIKNWNFTNWPICAGKGVGTYGKPSFIFKFSDFRMDSNPEKLKIVEQVTLLNSNVYACTRMSVTIANILDFRLISDCYTGVCVCVDHVCVWGDHVCVCGDHVCVFACVWRGLVFN